MSSEAPPPTGLPEWRRRRMWLCRRWIMHRDGGLPAIVCDLASPSPSPTARSLQGGIGCVYIQHNHGRICGSVPLGHMGCRVGQVRMASPSWRMYWVSNIEACKESPPITSSTHHSCKAWHPLSPFASEPRRPGSESQTGFWLDGAILNAPLPKGGRGPLRMDASRPNRAVRFQGDPLRFYEACAIPGDRRQAHHKRWGKA